MMLIAFLIITVCSHGSDGSNTADMNHDESTHANLIPLAGLSRQLDQQCRVRPSDPPHFPPALSLYASPQQSYPGTPDNEPATTQPTLQRGGVKYYYEIRRVPARSAISKLTELFISDFGIKLLLFMIQIFCILISFSLCLNIPNLKIPKIVRLLLFLNTS